MKHVALISLFLVVLATTGVSQRASETQSGKLDSSVEGDAANVLVADRLSTCAMKVSYERGDLGISAQHCRLLDILREVGKRTGAVVEPEPRLGEDVVFVDLGPGPAREVLAALLNGSGFNYIIVGSSTNPNGISQILLTPIQGISPATVSAVASLQEPTEEPSAYGVGFTADVEGATNEAPSSPPPSRAEALAAQQSPDGKKTPGQVLDELQKQQIKQLDEKAVQPEP